MGSHSTHHVADEETAGVRPHCPFCAAAWTDAMLAQFDSVTSPSSCACCGPVTADPVAIPADDLRCAACGRAIYRAPSTSID